MKIKKILVANRGEISIRVIRSAHEMGIKTVSVYSDADRQAPHVQMSEESIYIGESPSSESYLNMDRIIEGAINTGSDAIHPGYGFLSENAIFAQKVIDAGLIFIGPPPTAIEAMGSKLLAKKLAEKYNVPLVLGTTEPLSDITRAKKLANEIGYPILIKASAGGGGKGMRLVYDHDEFEAQMSIAIKEATASFGDGSVFIEKFVTNPKHIEFQIFGDQHGNMVHLFERDCSIQRRHQKVIEEAPSSILTPELRARMGDVAIQVAKSCGYYNAGTVEFLLSKNNDFYFLEMNTRLQVEHPVTELITGLDLVQLQIKIAEGEKIPFQQSDLQISGHAIEVRVYAEDPTNNFLPDIGTLNTYRRPQGHGVRVDDGYEEGMPIPFYYDPMIAKLICHAKDRPMAIEKMIRAIDEYNIVGVETTLSFGKFVMQHEAFRSGHFDTNFIGQHFKPDLLSVLTSENQEDMDKIGVALATKIFNQNQTAVSEKVKSNPNLSLWVKNRK